MWVYRSGTRQVDENRSAMQLQTSGLGAFFLSFLFLRGSIDVFLYFLVFVGSETIFSALAFVEVTPQLRKAQQTLPLLVLHLFHRFSLRKGRFSRQQQLSISWWYPWIQVRWLTRDNEEDNAVDEDKKFVERAARIFELHSRIIFLYFYLSGLKSNYAPFCYHGNCSSLMKAAPFVRAYSLQGLWSGIGILHKRNTPWVGVKRILFLCKSNNSLPVPQIVGYSRIMRAWINQNNYQAFALISRKK